MKRTKADFFALLDEWKRAGELPNGKSPGRYNVVSYMKETYPGEFVDMYGIPVRGFETWYRDHAKGEKCTVNPQFAKRENVHESPAFTGREHPQENPQVTPQHQNITFAQQQNITAQQIDDELSEKIKRLMHRKNDVCSLEELSNQFDTGIGRIRSAVEELKQKGFNVKIDGGVVLFTSEIPKSESTHLSVEKMSTGFYKFGVLGDNHLCSRYERLDVLNALYDLFETEGINVVYNTGNWIDGEARFNKHDLHTHGMDNQINYFIENYPQRKGIITKYITGDDHEGWYTQREGINIGQYTEYKAKQQGREDLIYLGHMEHDEIIKAKSGQTRIRVLHPGGGSSYATSYSVQKIVESYTGGDKPDILFVGHYHKSEYTYYRGVSIVQTGTTEDQTPFMRKKKLAAHLGGWIVEFSNDDKGAITRFKSEFIPFYDKEYYKVGWEYKW